MTATRVATRLGQLTQARISAMQTTVDAVCPDGNAPPLSPSGFRVGPGTASNGFRSRTDATTRPTLIAASKASPH